MIDGTMLIIALVGTYLICLYFWDQLCKRRDLRDRQASTLRKRIDREMYRIYNAPR